MCSSPVTVQNGYVIVDRRPRTHRSRADREALSAYVELSARADRRHIDRAELEALERLTPAQFDVLVADLLDGTTTAATPARPGLLRRLVGSEAGFATGLLVATALAGALTAGAVGAVALTTGGTQAPASPSNAVTGTSFDPYGDTPGDALDF